MRPLAWPAWARPADSEAAACSHVISASLAPSHPTSNSVTHLNGCNTLPQTDVNLLDGCPMFASAYMGHPSRYYTRPVLNVCLRGMRGRVSSQTLNGPQ